MNDTRKSLAKGTLKSAVSVACGVLLGESIIGDLHTWHGLLHVLEVIGAAVVVGEARFWKKWADSGNGNGQVP